MGLFEQLPYTNFHDINLTELVKVVKELAREMHEFEVVNKISYGGDWDITKQYAPWTVVCVNGTEGYISIKPVPAGVDYTNTEYWRLVADFTVQLADLGNRVAILEGEMITANSNISSLQNVTNWLRGLLTNSTRKVICISDSYGLTPDVNTSWIPLFKRIYGITNDNFYRSQGNGGGFVGWYPNLTFINQLQDIASTMTADEKNAVNDIIIGGGYNDADALHQGSTTASAIDSAVIDFIDYARVTFPNSKIYIVWLGWSNVNYAIHDVIRRVINIYYQASVIRTNNVAVIDGINWMHRIALSDNTGYHPTAVCAGAIAMSIASILNGGTDLCDLAPDYTGYIQVTIDRDTSTTTTLTCNNLRQTYRNGTVFTRWQSIVFSNASVIYQTNEMRLGGITDGCLVGGSGSFSGSVFPAQFIMNGTVYNCNILIHDGALWFGNASIQIPANSSITVLYGYGSTDVMM